MHAALDGSSLDLGGRPGTALALVLEDSERAPALGDARLQRSMSLGDFLRFMAEEQGETDEDRLVGLFEEHADSADGLSFRAFCRMLLSTANRANQNFARMSAADLGHPMTHYFIATGHNTYLTGTSSRAVERGHLPPPSAAGLPPWSSTAEMSPSKYPIVARAHDLHDVHFGRLWSPSPRRPSSRRACP